MKFKLSYSENYAEANLLRYTSATNTFWAIYDSQKDTFIETLEKRLNHEINAPTVATHYEVTERIRKKFGFI